MLVLRRNIGERIMIGDGIVLEVVDISRGVVKLGIVAPRDVSVLREELCQRQRDDNAALDRIESRHW